MSQKEALSRVHYILTGVRAESITGQFTAGIGTLDYANVLLGLDAISYDATRVPDSRYPLIIIDMPSGQTSYTKEMPDEGYPVGYFDDYYTFKFYLLVKVGGDRNSIIGKTGKKGILDFYEDFESVMVTTEANAKLTYSGSKYVEQIMFPIDVTDGEGLTDTGHPFCRMREFSIKYRRLAVDY